MQTPKERSLKVPLTFLLILVVFILLARQFLFPGMVRNVLYHPSRLEQRAPLPPIAADAQEIRSQSEAGNTIHGLYWPAPATRPTILFFHGNAQTVFEWAGVRKEWGALDCGLFLIDYPGYGKSSGRPSEKALCSAGKGALTWLTTHAGVPEKEIILFGKSLGGGVAIETAQGTRVKGFILESTFSSIPSMAKTRIPFLPWSLLLASERYDNLAKISNIALPVLVIHGAKDTIVPFDQGLALYEAAGEPKAHFWIDQADHNNAAVTAGVEYQRRLRQWID